jgi:WD40 repeat protein
VAFSPDGRLLATVGDDGTARLWEVSTHGELAALYSAPMDGWAVITPDGRGKAYGELGSATWWSVGLRRFEIGELEEFDPTIRRRRDDPIPGLEHVSRSSVQSSIRPAAGARRRWLPWRRSA